jgi:DNA-binding transcriptional LysR family regulator
LPKSTIECTSLACARALVENGDYVTLMPSQLFFNEHKPSSIALLQLDSPMPPWQVAMISRARHELSAVCVAFLDEVAHMATGIITPGKSAPARMLQQRSARDR